MANSMLYKSKNNGALWIQPAGANSEVYYLPCHDLEDVSEPQGSITLIQCINQDGEFETVDYTTAAPEPISTTLGTYIGEVADWIETVACPFGLYVLLRDKGKAGVFSTWERAFLLQIAKVTNTTYSGLVRKDEDVPAMHTFDVEGLPPVLKFFRLTSNTQAIDAGVGGEITSVRFLDEISCWNTGGSNITSCDTGYATTTADVGVAANVLSNATGTWTPTTADPFGADEDIADLAMFFIGRDTYRIIVARGTTDAGNPAEIAYSDDEGATWTTVNVGSTTGEFVVKKGGLFALDQYNIYMVSNLGRIYKSVNGGVSWTTVENANITANAYHAVHFLNETVGYAVGTSGLVVRTLDGGSTWGQTGSAAGANNLYSVFVLSKDRVWVGSTAGVLLYTVDGGSSTWGTRTLNDTTALVNDIVFHNDYYGVVGNGEYIQFTVTGGFEWDTVADTANLFTGDIVSVNVCSTRRLFGAAPTEIVQSLA